MMPGFVIHLAEAIEIMSRMREKPGADWQQAFLLGALLPDTRLGEAKKISHFWGEGQETSIARAPELSLFLDKYEKRLKEPVILGYYAHLHLDARYVREFWPQVLSFEDRDGNIELRKDRIHHVVLKHKGERIPFEQFFSTTYYYGDYTRSNHWFVQKYQIQPPRYRELDGVDMDEVEPEKLKEVLEELNILFKNGRAGEEAEMKVFALPELETLIETSAVDFCRRLDDLF